MPGTTANRSAPAGADATVREINQQPQVWEDASRAVSEKRAALDAFLGDLLKRDDLRIVLTGAGTSAFVGRIAAPALARKLGRQVDAIATTDIVADPRDSFPEDVPTLLVSFARSGNSPESVAATELADELLTDVSHLIVTCDQSGALYAGHIDRGKSQVLLMPTAANDQGFAMTSSFTSMLLSVLLAFGVADAPAAAALASSASDTLASRADSIRDLAASGIDRVVYLGSGALEGLANESALKMLELTAGNVVAYSESALGFRHGPKAILNDRTLVVVYVSSDPYTRLYDLDILNELRTSVAPGKLVAVSATPLELDGAEVWVLPEVANLGDGLAAIAFVVVAQLLALSASVNLGLTPDNPFPGGDVNRVVRGVHIHPLDG